VLVRGRISICWACRRRRNRSTSKLKDASPGAWERLIDRLLASPHYGERYGRLWLDIALRGSAGFEYDTHRPNAWRYRDYVISPSTRTNPTTGS
jgi:hypothetical protein